MKQFPCTQTLLWVLCMEVVLWIPLKLSNGTQECGERAVKTLLFLRFHFVNYNCSGGGARAFAFPLKIKKVADYHGTQIQPSD